MEMYKVKIHDPERFRYRLMEEEKAEGTIKKYLKDLYDFLNFVREKEEMDLFDDDLYCQINKSDVIDYKKIIFERYSVRSVNSKITSINSFFEFMNWKEIKLKIFKMQNELFRADDKNLTVNDYYKILEAAKKSGDLKMYYLMLTLCSTGIRISELPFVTVEAINRGSTQIYLKGKYREILLPGDLCAELQYYSKLNNISCGMIFITKSGNPMDRSNISKSMKKLARMAGVKETKVFPHNFRHLFAVSYYNKEKDICRLADILGHSNINTTRGYTLLSTLEHAKQIDSLGLIYGIN